MAKVQVPEGKVLVSCPHCAVQYAIAAELLDKKIECVDCHQRFLARAMAGKRVRAKDHSGSLMSVAVGIVVLLLGFVLYSLSGGDSKRERPVEVPEHVSRVDNPRAQKLVEWTKAVRRDHRAVLQLHTDLDAMADQLGLPKTPPEAAIAGLMQHAATLPLRTFDCLQVAMVGNEDVVAPTGSAVAYIAPKAGDAAYEEGTRGELLVKFRMQGDTLLVTGLQTVTLPRKKGDAPAPTPPTGPAKETGK
ncbi:MAG: hypothetical protein JNK15_14360 [Planctomycetes bacterium]|nr:hypothetical protein [Planctomycetota bacterium]